MTSASGPLRGRGCPACRCSPLCWRLLAGLLTLVAVPRRVSTHRRGSGLLALALCWSRSPLAEALVLHVEVGDDAQHGVPGRAAARRSACSGSTRSCSVAVRVLGALVGLAVVRRQAIGKLLFNVAS